MLYMILLRYFRMTFLLICILVFSPESLFSQCDWTQRADFGGVPRYTALGFSIGNKGYIGTGSNAVSTYYADFWEYRPSLDTWVQIASLPGAGRCGAFGFVINNLAYVGAGVSRSGSNWVYYNDFFKYDPTTNTWTQLGTLPFSLAGSTYFAINGKGYVLCGHENNAETAEVWEYDPANDSWLQKNNFPGGARIGMLSFTTASRVFVGTGGNITGSVSYVDFWEYHPTTDTWTQKANFTGPERNWSVGIGLQDKYCVIISGRETTYNNFLNDVWSYDIMNDVWIQEQSFPGDARYGAVAFSTNSFKAYFGTGANAPGSIVKDYWEFTPGNANVPVTTSNAPVCTGSALNLYASAIPGATYNWTGPNGFSSTQQNPVVSSSATTAMSGTYYVTSNLYGCTSNPGILNVEVNSTPPATPTIIQSGANLLSSSATGNQWYDQNGMIVGATNSYYTVTDNGSYYVVVSNGCGYAMSNTIVVTNAGLENNEINVLVYPNPANDFINIELVSEADNYIFQITNVFGQEIKTLRSSGKKSIISIPELAPGLYFLNVSDSDGHSATYRFSKQ